ncbi:MAG: multidrug efflux RND transporter permease subunit [Luteitalea sp.]|nr:multidrug efflux RND transporter permease subunit [Luteitalea sp.]
MFVDTFIRRPILASVCSFIIILAGAMAIPTMPIAQYPELAQPQVAVSAVYTGASAEVVETTVTQPLEQAINGVEGLVYMTSTSSNQGTSTITVTFDVTRDPDLAAVDVQNRVATAQARLPAAVQQLGVTVQKQSTGFLLGAAFLSENDQYDTLFMSNYVDVYVRDAIKRVPGVADVIIFGERRYSMRLWLDPDRLAGRGLTAADVVSALREQNVQVAAGQVGQPPARKGQSYQISVRAVGRLREASEFENIILKRGNDGALVRLADVGRAELGAETYDASLRYNGREAVGVGVMQLPTANALDVYRDVTAELDRLSESFPPGFEYEIAFDTTTAVQESIREVITTLAEAIFLVLLVMFFFLQDWRSTVVPAITIPVCLVGAFAFMKLFGFSINTLTLFGITLATGLVVDDAIVVVENIQRHIHDYGKSARVAASEAMGEVIGPVIATSLVLASVFVPVALFPGTTGRLYQQFALVIAVAVTISAFTALTMSPAISALLLRSERTEGRFWHLVNRGIDGFSRGYIWWLHRLVNRKAIVAVCFALGLVATYWIYTRVPSGFVPDEDAVFFMVTVQAPDGASLDYTSNITRQSEKILLEAEEVSGVFSVHGFSFLGGGPNRGMQFVRLKSFDERSGDEHSSMAVVERLRPALMGISGAMVIPFQFPAIPGIGQFGGFTFELQDQSGGAISRLAEATGQLTMQGNQTPGLAGLFSAFTINDPQLTVTVDRERLKALDLSFEDVTSTLQTLMGSVYVNDFDFNNRSYRVYVQADQQFRAQPQDLGRYQMRTPDGQMVRLETVSSVAEATSPQIISHYNMFRSTTINGGAAPGFSSGQALGIMEDLARRTLPQGMTFAWSGLSREEIAAGGQAMIIFGLGLLLVYLTLAAQYESLVLPFIILLSVPLAVMGALLAQWGRGLINDVYCQIGLLMLIGLATKQGILVVEFAEQLRRRGLSVVEAAIEASRIRLRPILMTSLSLIFGVMPLALATGAGRFARHSVGTTVIGGMILATILNLIIIPVMYIAVRSLLPTRAAAPAEASAEEPA